MDRRRVRSLALLAMGIAVMGAAQTTRVTVRDASGSVIPNAEVRIRNSQSEQLVRTDDQGTFSLPVSPTGDCSIEVRSPGFEPFEARCSDVAQGIRLRSETRRESIVVTSARGPISISESVPSITVLDERELQRTAAITLDDALRQAPGFNLFRRTGSRTANPTSQGASLRGVGASGASRALVLFDGVPLNDPFGGWVYWSRVPRMDVSGVEVLAGGGSHLFGSDALSGVINVLSQEPRARELALEVSYGNQQTPDLSGRVGRSFGSWSAGLSGEIFHTDGYVLVPFAERGPVDAAAGNRHGVLRGVVQRSQAAGRVFVSAGYFRESRRNGTAQQFNRTELGQLSAGAEHKFASGSLLGRLYGSPQSYRQNFTAVTADRQSETLTRDQSVPSQQVGGSLQWSGALGRRHNLVLGPEFRNVRGLSDEIAFIAGAPNRLIRAGGRQLRSGFFAQDRISIGSRTMLTAGARIDGWKNYRGVSRTASLQGTALAEEVFPSRTDVAFSPSLGGLLRLTDTLTLTANYYGAFRAPTLNELYRSFRVGNIVTEANSSLAAEHLFGGETSLRLARGRLTGQVTFFWNVVEDPIVNRTLSVTPALVTRQRQNLGSTRSRGIEVSVNTQVSDKWSISTAYQYVVPEIMSFPTDVRLVGLVIPQTPRQQWTLQTSYAAPRGWILALQARATGEQFEDDLNSVSLGPFFQTDVLLSKQHRATELFVAAENIFNDRAVAGQVPVTLLGPPILVRGGVRLRLSR